MVLRAFAEFDHALLQGDDRGQSAGGARIEDEAAERTRRHVGCRGGRDKFHAGGEFRSSTAAAGDFHFLLAGPLCWQVEIGQQHLGHAGGVGQRGEPSARGFVGRTPYGIEEVIA